MAHVGVGMSYEEYSRTPDSTLEELERQHELIDKAALGATVLIALCSFIKIIWTMVS